MQTALLIDQLTQRVDPVPHRPVARALAPGLLTGAVLSLCLVAAVYGIQPGLGTFDHGAPFLMKLCYAGTLAGIALALTSALARPGIDAPSWRLLLLPVGGLLLLAAFQFAQSPMAAWPAMMMGGSWDKCPWRVIALAVPVFAGLTVVTRRQAPTQLRRAGTAIGLASGATAASIYALACTESSAAFVLIWYSLGIALCAGLGALVGPRLLRW